MFQNIFYMLGVITFISTGLFSYYEDRDPTYDKKPLMILLIVMGFVFIGIGFSANFVSFGDL